MLYRNNFEKVKTIKKNIPFKNFSDNPKLKKDGSLLSITDGVECYNFDTTKGDLENGYGLKDLTVKYSGSDYQIALSDSSEVQDIWIAKWLYDTNSGVQDYLFYMLGDGKVYYREMAHPNVELNLGHTFEANPTLTKVYVSGGEAFAFTSPDDDLILLTQGATTTFQDVPKVIDLCYHYSKLFAITSSVKNSLVYSTNTDIEDWTEENVLKIEFNDEGGRLLKLKVFDDSIYIFREYGITKVCETNGSFSVENVYSSDFYIFPESVCECLGNIVFLCENGLFKFNGKTVKKLEYDIFDKVDLGLSAKPCAESFDGKYFLACKQSFLNSTVGCESATFVNNAVLIFDIDLEKVQVIRGVDVKKLVKFNSSNLSKLCAIFRGSKKMKIGEFVKNQSVFGTTFKQCWTSAFCDLGYKGKLKHIFKFLIKSKGCIVKIKSDMEEKSYIVTSSNDVQLIKADVKGREFLVSVESNVLNQKISDFEVFVSVYQ